MPTEMELTLEQTQQGVSYEVSVLSDIEDSHGPSDAKHKPLPATQSQKDFVSKLTEIHSFLLTLSLRVDPHGFEGFSNQTWGGMTKALIDSPCFIANDFRYSDTTHLSRSVEVLKLKNFKKDATLKLFKNGMSMSVQKSQVHKMAKFQDGKVSRWQRDCAWLMISRCSRSQCQIQVQGTSSIQEVNDHHNIFTRESS
ncbi:hypothetical protein Tco_1107902 [Tanacetum coccineum]